MTTRIGVRRRELLSAAPALAAWRPAAAQAVKLVL